MVLGDQDLTKIEFHEQSFGVQKIFKYSHYVEIDSYLYNDIGKSLLFYHGFPFLLSWVDFSSDRKLRLGSGRCSKQVFHRPC